MDEVGYYTVSGLAVMSAQARSLGFSLVFATQDIPAMLRNDDKEAKSMIANTTTKVFMRVEETEMTAKLAVDSAGKGQFAKVSGFAAKSGEFSKPYLDNMEARFEEQERITVRNLRALGVGEAYVTWRDSVFKVKTFHAFPEGEYGDGIAALELRANHFIAFAKPTKEEVKKIGVLTDVAERLDDVFFASKIEERAKEARAAVVKAANEKRDPTMLRNEISAGSVAFLRAAYGDKDKRKATATDLITAGAASIAAIMQAMQKQGDKFAADVRKLEGLGPAATARSGRTRAASEVPGLVDPTSFTPPGRTTAGTIADAVRRPGVPARPLPIHQAPPPVFDDEFDDAPPEPDDAFSGSSTADLASALDRLGSPEARREAATSAAPSRMKEVAHGITVDNEMHKIAEKVQSNDHTLQFLSALDFGGEPGQDAVEEAIESAITGSDGDLSPQQPPAKPVTAADLERADVASARAAQWTERSSGVPAKPAAPAADTSQDFVKHVASGNVDAMTSAFLADLLED
ncbi:TraM recognition domain-containing protein [Bradyrhizobium japonicum]|uniref:TraM recognition domain-containing protein n=1 Tax=Bradyrhizobium japonicum TaxID=375 RepID=UPI001BA5AF88|nr:TraM recognition domain-containing protein [Bradyrhizobium japonicum]MBR0734980.1 TraM recognition domain-containing protein [Bradyrhizobium japonicum]MBR0809454.1 TraM recognition domain-containing protein [Bradyrhizobium japonicum]